METNVRRLHRRDAPLAATLTLAVAFTAIGCSSNAGEPTSSITASAVNSIIVPPIRRKHVAGDFDGDGKSDLTIWRPAAATWYVVNSSGAPRADVQWGVTGDVPVPADYDGDGRADRAVWRPSVADWYVRYTSGAAPLQVQWGQTGDIPAPGDYDGDGIADLAVWRPSAGIWYVINSSGAARHDVVWGVAGDIPVPADFDGDGKTDRAVFRPSVANWFVIDSATGATTQVQWGQSGDIPITGDYDGDGKADLVVFRPSVSTWYVRYSSGASSSQIAWGNPGDVPVAGDFDGDGKSDRAVWSPSDGTWHVANSSNPQTESVSWGVYGDEPLPYAHPGGVTVPPPPPSIRATETLLGPAICVSGVDLVPGAYLQTSFIGIPGRTAPLAGNVGNVSANGSFDLGVNTSSEMLLTYCSFDQLNGTVLVAVSEEDSSGNGIGSVVGTLPAAYFCQNGSVFTNYNGGCP